MAKDGNLVCSSMSGGTLAWTSLPTVVIKQEHEYKKTYKDLFGPNFPSLGIPPEDTDLSSCDGIIPRIMDDPAGEVLCPQLQEKSRQKYELAFTRFEKWCEEHQMGTMDEKVLLAYFQEKSTEFRVSSLWAMYSMIRSIIKVKYDVDISQYTNLLDFLKRNGKGYKAKKSRVFTREEISKFLLEADDQKYLFMKVALIIGISGSCRRDEMVSLLAQDVKDEEYFFEITIRHPRNKLFRNFLVTSGSIQGVNLVDIVRKYFLLRPADIGFDRFFIQYLNGKCSKQPVGINSFGAVPRKIAEYLGLSNAREYTGNCFRRASPTVIANSVADLLAINRNSDGWKDTYIPKEFRTK